MSQWRLLLTRPQDECVALAATLAEHGVYSSSLPLLNITALEETVGQRETLAQLDHYSAVIVVSKPAARLALKLLERNQVQVSPAQPWFSVGAATGEVLSESGMDAHWPEQGDDSEALLALPRLKQALSTASAPRVLIIRGKDGRELLADSLRDQGVVVDYLELYRRDLPEYSAGTLHATLSSNQLNGVVVSSGQGFKHLLHMAGEHWPALSKLTLFVPSLRVAEQARAAGAEIVVNCRGANAAALLVALQAESAPPSYTKDGYVSEATSPKEQPVLDAPKPAPKAPTQAKSSSANGLALIAILLGAAGIAVGGWSVWQLRMLQANEQQQVSQLEQTQAQAAALSQQAKSLDSRLQSLPPPQELDERRRLVLQLQGDQQLLNKRLETVLGASRQEWRLAEAEHLLRLASLRLSALQDINSATALVRTADEIVRDQDDPAAYAVREQLAKSLEALLTTPNPDRTGLFLQLGALRDQGMQLNALNPSFKGDGGALGQLAEENYGQGWWSGLLETAGQYVRLDFNADQNIRPLLAGQSLTQVRLALSLALEQAQWAALHGQTAVYKQALTQAVDVLDGNFNKDNPSSRALRARVAELIDQTIEVKAPDLTQSINAMQAYIEQKQSARERLKNAPAEGKPATEEAAQ